MNTIKGVKITKENAYFSIARLYLVLGKGNMFDFQVLLRNNIKYFNYIFLWNEGNIGHELPIEYSWAIDHM